MSNLTEGVWSRSLHQTRRGFERWPARIVAALLSAGFAALGALLPEGDTGVNLLLAVLGVIGGPLVCGLVLFLYGVASAPYRQRNEARRLLIHAGGNSAGREPIWFPSYDEAAADMVREISQRVSAKSLTEVRCIFVTGESGWPMLQGLIIRALENAHNRLDVDISVLDPDGLDDDDLRDRVQRTIRNMTTFLVGSSRILVTRQFKIALYGYRHRPSWHAVLVDHDLLYFTPSNPEDLRLAGQQHGTEKITGGSPYGRGRIRHVAAWLDEITSENPLVKSGHRLPAAAKGSNPP